MLDLYLQSLETITDERHYLKRDSELLSQYRHSYAENIRFLIDKLTFKQQNDLLQNKLLFRRKFDSLQEKKFIQAACEATVVSFFAERFPYTFLYEPRLNETNKTNVECQFKTAGYIYNIEVKCPTFQQQEAQNLGQLFHFEIPTRLDSDSGKLVDILIQAMNDDASREGRPGYVIPHRMDNNLKDYLSSANKKFEGASSGENVNILVVCCGDITSVQYFYNYLYQDGGFFSDNPNSAILAVEDYKYVDVVILCNLYHRHYNYFDKAHLKANWDFSESFNLIFSNIYRENLDGKAAGVGYLRNRILPNYTYQFDDFANKRASTLDFQQEFLNATDVEQFIVHKAQKGVILF